LVFLKANIAWCASVEDGEWELVGVLDGLLQLHYGVDTFDDLATKNACFRKARTEEKDVALYATRFESTFDVLDERSVMTLVCLK